MSNHTMSIWLWSDGLSFAIADNEPTHIPLSSHSATDYAQLGDALLAHDGTTDDFDNVTCHVATTRFVVIPSNLADDDIHAMYDVVVPRAERAEVLLNNVDEASNVRFAYGIDEGFYHFLLRTYPDIAFTHPLFELHSRYYAPTPMGTNAKLVAVVDRSMLYVLVYRRDTLQLANAYETSDTDNIAYYIMNTWQQIDLDVLADVLVLDDTTRPQPQLREMLSTWIKHVI